jgi:hydroxymethylbilane synthase
MTTYKIGTRGSLLAVTQSTLIKNELERLSGETFELVLIKTEGDLITSKPLWQLDGKDFFTKELDEALLKGEVDFVIHSYKDLGSERPQGIKLAAITERRFAHDILLISKETIAKLKDWSGELIVGTSSPRRMTNLTKNLGAYLPHSKNQKIVVKCESLRGNVNTRIKKLREGHYHAITLALAGIERLAHSEKSANELKELLEGLNYFVLPQSVFPSAASQGALGIEMQSHRQDGGKLAKILDQLNHSVTIEEVKREREAFKNYGGGCHLAVGIHVKKIGEQFLHVHAGEVDGKRIEVKKLEGNLQSKISPDKKLFVGLQKNENPEIFFDEIIEKQIKTKKTDLTHKHVFVTSRYCIPTILNSINKQTQGIWAAGVKTAQLLAQEGVWINGTSDSLGTRDLIDLKSSKVLQILSPEIQKSWVTLTHDQGESDLGEVIGCYQRVTKEVTKDVKEKMQRVGACYWTSFHQYQTYLALFPHLQHVKHFCGLGKTWQEFKNANIPVSPVASMQEFYELK